MTFTVKPCTFTCPVTFKTTKAFRLWLGDKMMAAWSWDTAREAKAAAQRLARHWPDRKITIITA